jgi:hypothetical protein
LPALLLQQLVLPQGMARAAEDRLIQIYIAVPDFQVEPTLRISANPGFIMNRCPLAAEIGQRNQIANFAFQTLWKGIDFHYLFHLLQGCIKYSII